MISNKSKKFSIKARLKSFRFAFNGIKILIKEEHNARIHLFVGSLAVVFGFLLEISKTEWLILCLTIALVISLEIVNSAIEGLADFITREKNESIKRIKDLSAAAVLVSAIASIIIGIIIFVPKIIALC